jgi:carboxyl-terminal processing protease
MTGQLEGIGAQLQEKGDYIEITKIITGSACWRQGDLEVGDKILRVAQGDAPDEPVDLVGMSVRDAVQYIRGPKGTKVILTVRKVDGSKTTIPIVRDVVELESTFAKSAVVGEGQQKIGYIRLPKFYVSFYSDHNRDVSDDVRTELEKLKEAGVKGVILDLRNNGGGALNEVVEIVGHFIDEGPVVQVKPSGQKPKILQDEARGRIYDGPLAVMTNRFSASASEIFAAAIQDYDRGLIVGSPSTFGKGTVQNVLEMDRAVGNAYKDLKPLGALKLTIQKFYRINGGTTQKRGVVPDLILPDTYGDMPMGERNRETALPYDEIKALDYQHWASGPPPLSKLQRKSEKRLQKSEKFQAISRYAQWSEKRRENSKVALSLADYRAQQEEERQTAKQFNGMRKSDTTLTVTANAADLEKINATGESQKKAEQWHKNISDDVYLHETYALLRDWAMLGK